MPRKQWVNEAGLNRRRQRRRKEKQEQFKDVMKKIQKRKENPTSEEENQDRLKSS